MEITVEALDPFSSLIPLATDIKHAVEGQQDNYYGCEKAPCTSVLLFVAVWSVAQLSVGPRQTARAQPLVLYQLAEPGCPKPVISLISALAPQPSARLEPTSQSSLCSTSLCLSFWLQFLSIYPNALALSYLLRWLRSWILPSLNLLHIFQYHTVCIYLS